MRLQFGDALKAVRSAGDAAAGAARKVADAGVQAKDAVVDLGNGAIDVGIAARDTVTGTVEAVGQFARTAKDVATTVSFYGFVVSAVVAPIPTLIGLLLMDLMLASVGNTIAAASDDLAAKRLARENARILDRLAKYGTIPATAIVETPHAVLNLDTVAGTISGRIKAGPFEGRELGGMTDDELRRQSAASDPDTAKMIDGYLRHRTALVVA